MYFVFVAKPTHVARHMSRDTVASDPRGILCRMCSFLFARGHIVIGEGSSLLVMNSMKLVIPLH